MVDVKNTTYKKQGQCPSCGKPCKLNAKKCRECHLDNQGKNARKAFFNALRARPCVQCGKPLNSTDRRKIACSNECGYRNRHKEKIEVPCLVCGKHVVRYKHDMEKFSGACCSDACQQKWAGRRNGHKRHWESKSRRAKSRWKRASTLGRKRSNPWWKAIQGKCTKAYEVAPWIKSLECRLASGIGRKTKRTKALKTSQSIHEAYQRIDRKRAWFNLPEWDKRLTNKFSNMNKRRRRKDEIKAIKNSRDVQEDRAVWFQMCFDWLGDNTQLL